MALLLAPIIALIVIQCAVRRSQGGPEYVARSDVASLHLSITEYRRLHGDLPPPTTRNGNAALVRALRGENPKQLIFHDFPEEQLQFEEDGPSFIDPWGMPYQYRLEGSNIVVWSYGPDKIDSRGDGDDIKEAWR